MEETPTLLRWAVRFVLHHLKEDGTEMKKHLVLVALFAIVLMCALAACAGSGGGAAGAPKVDWKVSITGAVSKPLTLTYADLAKRPQVTLKDVLMQRSQGEATKNTWSGPALDAILKDAGISANAKGITCLAKDGYAMKMTMDDVKNAIIALKQDDKFIDTDPKAGPVRLLVPDKTANFWVGMLTEIQVAE
jgi:DMSO/TMAO reductase YedYZ molybdopterin-dependent catalytic subunit